ncbi:17142_t:CDS:1, partial [Funneliformis geosporum]
PQDRYTNFVNNVQQNIVINIIKKQNPSELESSFKTFISFIENIVENISVGNNFAKRKSLIKEKGNADQASLSKDKLTQVSWIL